MNSNLLIFLKIYSTQPNFWCIIYCTRIYIHQKGLIMEQLICKHCGVIYYRYQSRRSKYCSSKCSEDNKRVRIVNNFSKIDSISSYFLGFLYGDGSIDRNNKVQVCLSNKDDGSNLILLRLLSDYVLGFDRVNIYNDRIHLQFTDEMVAKNLNVYGIVPNKTYGSKIILPHGFERDFIRGYFDADGWVSTGFTYNKQYDKKYKRNVIGLCSFLKQNLIDISEHLPFYHKIHKKKNQELYYITWSSKKTINQFYQNLYGEPNLTKKWDKISGIIND